MFFVVETVMQGADIYCQLSSTRRLRETMVSARADDEDRSVMLTIEKIWTLSEFPDNCIAPFAAQATLDY
jgi:hypothetical protein